MTECFEAEFAAMIDSEDAVVGNAHFFVRPHVVNLVAETSSEGVCGEREQGPNISHASDLELLRFLFDHLSRKNIEKYITKNRQNICKNAIILYIVTPNIEQCMNLF